MTSERRSSSRTTALLLLLVIAAASASACSRIRDQVVTPANRDDMVGRVAQSSLSNEDKRLFVAFFDRVDALEAHGRWSDAKSPYDGQTVAQIIDVERARRRTADVEQEQRASMAAAAKAGAAAVTAAINKALTVSVVDTRIAQFGVLPYCYIKLAAENRSAREIAGFAGRLTIRDKFGNEVGHAAIDVTESVRTGARMTWEELVTDVAVGTGAATSLKFEWTPDQVTFQDGSKLGPVKRPG